MFLPSQRNDYQGPTIVIWFLVIYNLLASIRSLIHILLPDGGAHSIAGMNLKGNEGQNLVAIFGQWGAVQLIVSIFIWIVLWRYREFIPLMIAEVLMEQILRLSIGQIKPYVSSHTPPGAYGTIVLLPISLIMLFISLIKQSS